MFSRLDPNHLIYAATAIDDYLPLPGSIEDLTFTGALILLVVAFIKEWVVPGGRERRLETRLDSILESLDKLADGVEKTVAVNDELRKRLEK